ncbi:Ankyrin repeat-containing domain protein [Cordyceps fumosorosea ARSEF 2679]|uniref:Ankyrin repeat-containing domain protein n=1 Tax=Cordyceps fumosorosea (strain ARSEF 2679) TaxID=1081104 RepID=A0A167LMX4_CORFA|nr:Ankyrin repeat-containing domain protein [Cordyceps fumosorosea ARSEF 2679]OAA53277.1 Ankyrin repeat-containing domain protein [Cordyceps fumosorosea ARSEF 2679]
MENSYPTTNDNPLAERIDPPRLQQLPIDGLLLIGEQFDATKDRLNLVLLKKSFNIVFIDPLFKLGISPGQPRGGVLGWAACRGRLDLDAVFSHIQTWRIKSLGLWEPSDLPYAKALSLAARAGHREMVRLLVDAGADVNRDAQALVIAVLCERHDIVKHLLSTIGIGGDLERVYSGCHALTVALRLSRTTPSPASCWRTAGMTGSKCVSASWAGP